MDDQPLDSLWGDSVISLTKLKELLSFVGLLDSTILWGLYKNDWAATPLK